MSPLRNDFSALYVVVSLDLDQQVKCKLKEFCINDDNKT